eukprot:2066683-Lingulodinium_polyedra.AAC.1
MAIHVANVFADEPGDHAVDGRDVLERVRDHVVRLLRAHRRCILEHQAWANELAQEVLLGLVDLAAEDVEEVGHLGLLVGELADRQQES